MIGRTGRVVLLVLLLVAVGCRSDDAAAELGLVQPDTLTVGADQSNPPFSSAENGRPVGFDIDLITEIAKRLELDVDLRDVAFEKLFAQVGDGSVDVIISAIDVDAARDHGVAFSQPYFTVTQALVVREGSPISGFAALVDEPVGVVANSTGLDYVNDQLPDVALVEFPTADAAFAGLSSEQVNAVVVESAAAGDHSDVGGAIQVVEQVATGGRFGIGVDPTNRVLREAIDAQLAEMIADGTYARIHGAWFPGDPPEAFRATGPPATS